MYLYWLCIHALRIRLQGRMFDVIVASICYMDVKCTKGYRNNNTVESIRQLL